MWSGFQTPSSKKYRDRRGAADIKPSRAKSLVGASKKARGLTVFLPSKKDKRAEEPSGNEEEAIVRTQIQKI